MKLCYCLTKIGPVIFACLLIAAFHLSYSSALNNSPDDPSGGCFLNFTSYPYEPTGECMSDRETITVWDSFRTTRCCRNALSALSQALAHHANATQNMSDSNFIFIAQDQWAKCSGSFFSQNSVSLNDCGFGELFSGIDQCSGLTLTSAIEEVAYQVALKKCSGGFDDNFDEKCGNCTSAIVDFRTHLMDLHGVRDGDDIGRGVCGLGAIVSVAAGNLQANRSVTDSFYRCLPALDTMNHDYFKIKYSDAKMIFALVMAVIALLMIIMLIRYVAKKKPEKPTELKDVSAWSGLYRFSRAEIENAINFGDEKESLGRGSAGQVYKGILPSGQVVAIKEIYVSNSSDSFLREVSNLSRVRHPNLVCLLGCCLENGKQYLVYEYCQEGNLAIHLLRRNGLLSWRKRVEILRNCALALRYLHRFIDGCIVHRDIKLTNILLTDKLQPKLSDFGLAKMLGMDETRVFTDVRGTIGYMDPEYMSNAKLTCSSDIYSFGIVILQLLSGQKVFELDLEARDQLTRKAKDVNLGTRPQSDFEDPSLNGKIDKADFASILQIGVLCVARSSKGRPAIDVIFEELDKIYTNTLGKESPESVIISSAMSKSYDVIPV